MNSTVKSAVDAAVKSLDVPDLPNVTPAGQMQIERQGLGDVQDQSISKKREVKSDHIDGNISGDAFDRVW